MKKLNIITGTAISNGLQENTKALNSLFKMMENKGLSFKEKSFGDSIREARKTMDELGLVEDALYDHYENCILPIRSFAVLKNLKTENISYKVLNIKNTPDSKPGIDITTTPFYKMQEEKLNEEILNFLSSASAFQVLTISVNELENEAFLAETASLFEN